MVDGINEVKHCLLVDGPSAETGRTEKDYPAKAQRGGTEDTCYETPNGHSKTGFPVSASGAQCII